MITNLNPFLRNDYYPDQNDIDTLNTRINEVQSDVDLLAITVNEKTEAVNGRLNNFQDDYNESFETEALSANIADINVLNVNVQATIKDLNAINTYTENLIVNKPVQDLALKTPHLENTTSLNGNFYNPKIIGGEVDSIELKNIQDFNAINVKANKVKAKKLVGDFSAEPISSSAVVGYDENGQLIPVRASFDVSFPENANYLRTDIQGVARKGTSESEVVQSTNLIQAGAVQNMYDAVNANFDSMHDAVNTNLNNVYDAINANLNNIYNNVNTNFNNVENTFNDLANSLNNMNMVTENVINDVSSHFNSVESNLNDIKSSIETINDFIFNDIYIPEYGSFNSSSPVNYQKATTVELYGNAAGGNAVPNGGGVIKFDSSTNTVTFGFSGACRGIKDARSMFNGCLNLTQNILIPNSVVNARSMFNGCLNLTQNILIPNSVVNAASMFAYCSNLNQNILIPNSVEDATNMFADCSNLNQNILIPNSVVSAVGMFESCAVLNQNILIPNSVEDATNMFSNCQNLNQNILISNSVVNTKNMFTDCSNLNQNILIPNSVKYCKSMFAGCSSLNQNILISNSVEDAGYMFSGCSSLNQKILIPNSATDCNSAFNGCVNLNQDVYIYSQNINISVQPLIGEVVGLNGMFLNTKVNLHNVHIPTSVPKDTSNYIYNCLVNNYTGLTFAPENIINDLPVDPVVWPPIL